MGLLSFLGKEILDDTFPTTNPLVTILATKTKRPKKMNTFDTNNFRLSMVSTGDEGVDSDNSYVSILVGYGNEDEIENKTENMNFTVSGLGTGEWRYTVYRLDNIHTNPYDVWNQLGSPVFPEKEVRQKMREVEVSIGVIIC